MSAVLATRRYLTPGQEARLRELVANRYGIAFGPGRAPGTIARLHRHGLAELDETDQGRQVFEDGWFA